MKRRSIICMTFLAVLSANCSQSLPSHTAPVTRGNARQRAKQRLRVRASNVPGPAAATLPDSYLLLVTFAGGKNPRQLAEFAKSSYNGIAIQVVDAYDTSPPPPLSEILPAFSQYKAAAGNKDIWPWVFLNRIVGYNAAENNKQAEQPLFRSIRGLDLDDRTGARTGFLQMWRTSLQLARRLGSPGVVLDLEYYNYHGYAAITRVAEQSGHNPDALVQMMIGMGEQMADIANAEYPNVEILCYNTGLTYPTAMQIRGKSYYPTRSYFPLGMLMRAQQQHMSIQVFAGGENSLGFCHASLQELEDHIRQRQSQFQPLLSRYRNLKLAGMIAPWSDISARSGWIRRDGECGAATARNAEDFIPYIQLLARTYPLVWIYAAPVGGYDPFDSKATPRFNRMLQQGTSVRP